MFLDNIGTNSTLNIPLSCGINPITSPLSLLMPSFQEVLSKLYIWLGDTSLFSLALGSPFFLCTLSWSRCQD